MADSLGVRPLLSHCSGASCSGYNALTLVLIICSNSFIDLHITVTDKADVQYIVDLLEDDSTNHLTQMRVTFVRIMARIDARLSRNLQLSLHQYDISHLR